MATIKLEIGGWWAECCIHDLYYISTEQELYEAAYSTGENSYPRGRYWPTLEAALAELEAEQGPDPDDYTRGMFAALRTAFGLGLTDSSISRGALEARRKAIERINSGS